MKVSCSVEIVNRSLPSLNLRSKGARTLANISLCHDLSRNKDHSDKSVFFIVSTYKYPNGTKYKVYNNVGFFTKFINEGKVTVRVKDPPHDIMISKADPLQLKGFMRSVGLIQAGQGNGKAQLSTPPTKFDRPKQRLAISERKHYPLKGGFPSTLTSLHVQNCLLRKIDSRMLKLENLQLLDLANNCIKELPLSLANMKLKELILCNNEIEFFPPELSRGSLGQNLRILDLSDNKIKRLSSYFCLMKKLRVLSLKGNHLNAFPRNIACLESLQILNASRNHLKVLPFGIRKLHFDTLDLFHNPLNEEVILKPEILWQVPSLLECSALSVIANSLPFTARDIPSQLVDYLIQRCPCPCGRMVFQRFSYCIFAVELNKLAATVAYLCNTSNFKVPMKVYFCSSKCWKKFLPGDLKNWNSVHFNSE